MAAIGGIIFNSGFERLSFIAFKNLFKLNIKGNKNGGLTAILNKLKT